MPSAQQTYYDSYVKQVTADNVAPILCDEGKWPDALEGEEWSRPEGRDALSNRWGDPEYGPVSVWVSSLGRVMEVQSLRRGASFIAAIHRTRDDFYNYRRPLGMFHYLYT